MSQVFCCICQEYIEFGRNILITVCNHVYHHSCIIDMRCVLKFNISPVFCNCRRFIIPLITQINYQKPIVLPNMSIKAGSEESDNIEILLPVV